MKVNKSELHVASAWTYSCRSTDCLNHNRRFRWLHRSSWDNAASAWRQMWRWSIRNSVCCTHGAPPQLPDGCTRLCKCEPNKFFSSKSGCGSVCLSVCVTSEIKIPDSKRQQVINLFTLLTCLYKYADWEKKWKTKNFFHMARLTCYCRCGTARTTDIKINIFWGNPIRRLCHLYLI